MRDAHTHRLIGVIYGVRRRDWLNCHDLHTKFHEDFGSDIQKFIGGIHRHTGWRSHKFILGKWNKNELLNRTLTREK